MVTLSVMMMMMMVMTMMRMERMTEQSFAGDGDDANMKEHMRVMGLGGCGC